MNANPDFLPWHITGDGQVLDAAGENVTAYGFSSVMSPGPWMVDAKARAAYIVTAANAFPDLVEALANAAGYLLNAKIDLETGCTKATAIKTIDGGLATVRAALAKAGAS